jgi:hypothetical protein
MNSNNESPARTSKTETYVQRPSQPWLRLPVFLVVAVVMVTLSAVTALADSSSRNAWQQSGGTVPQPAIIYLGFKSSDEIEFDDDQEDFVYKNEDIVAFDPATGGFSIYFDGSECGLEDANLDDFDFLSNGHLIFTLRSHFTIEGLGEVDDSDVIEYTPDSAGCGMFTFYLKGAEFGLTKGEEDIDALGVDENDNLVISTIGTAQVPGSTGELEAKDTDLIKLENGTWSLFFDGSDVDLTDSSEDIRSVWLDAFNMAQGIQNIYLTLSGDFDVESDNEDEGDKNDVKGCSLLQSGDTTACFFHKLFDGEEVGAENQLDGLAVAFGGNSTPVSAIGSSAGASDAELAAEAASDLADFVEVVAQGASGVTLDDFMEVASRIYLPYVQQ